MKNTLLALAVAAILMPTVSFASERSTIETLQARIIVLLQEQVQLLKAQLIAMEKLQSIGETEPITVTSEPIPAEEILDTDYDRYCREAIAKEPEKVHYFKKDQYSRGQRCFVTKTY